MSPFLALGALILTGSGLALTLAGSPALDAAGGMLIGAGLVALAGAWLTRPNTTRHVRDGYATPATAAQRQAGGA